MNAFQIMQGVETLGLRMQKHIDNTRKIVAFLDRARGGAVGGVSGARVPSRSCTDAKKLLPRRLRRGVQLRAQRRPRCRGKRLIERLKLFSHLANVGDAKSLVIHPATTTHYRMDDEALRAAGITDGTVRLSIGLETADDLIEDLSRALYASQKA
jgi:O-acetylhomoserine (thiol)-lyase